MKKSASGAPVTRMRPSAPTPRCRSQIAAIIPASSETRPSRSSIRTKSFPVPLYLPNFISPIQVLHQLVDDRDRARIAGLEPSDPRIAPEPRRLPPGQLSGSLGDPVGGLVQGDPSRHVLDGLSVPDGLPRGRGKPAPLEQGRGLRKQAALELVADASLDPRTKRFRL